MGKLKKNEKNIPLGAREKMPFWYSLAWSSRGISLSINTLMLAYLTYYCTDMLGLSAIAVGSMLVISKIIDAVTDISAGYIVEKTHSKFGKGRPYELFIIFTWVFTIMMFSVPELGTTGKYIYVFIMYVLVNAICVTMLGAVDSVYMARAFTTDNNRMKAMSVNGSVVMILAIVFNILFPQLLNTMGATKAGWTKMTLIVGIPLALIGLLRFLLVKEVVTDETEKGMEEKTAVKSEISLGKMMQLLVKNKYFFIFLLFNF